MSAAELAGEARTHENETKPWTLTAPDHISELVLEHHALAHQLTARMASRVPRHVGRDQLLSAALLGLLQAARGFDPARGIPFERFAANRIWGSLLDELRSQDWAPRVVRTEGRRLAATTEALTSKLRRAPTEEELAVELAVEPGEISRIAAELHRSMVLQYEAMGFDTPVEDLLPSSEPTPEDQVIAAERRDYLSAAISVLPDRLNRVVIGYFFENLPMLTLAEELGVTESRISQMCTEALSLMREGINAQLDPDAMTPEVLPNGRAAKRRATYYAAVAAAAAARRAAG